MRKFYTLISSLILTCVFLTFTIIIYNKKLNSDLQRVYNESVASYYGVTVKDQGVVLQKQGIKNGDFMLYGSSELGAEVPQNPKDFFQTKKGDLIVNVVGRGYSQTLEHSINFGALSKDLKGKKVGFVVSLQWFLDQPGISPDNFAMNFSELQFYKFMNNPEVSFQSKQYVAARVYDLIKNNNTYKQAAIYAKCYSEKSFLYKATGVVLKPYYLFREQILIINDKIKAIKAVQTKPVDSSKLKPIDWNNELKIAEETGKKDASNNEYFIDNNYFNKNIKAYLPKIQNIDKNINIADSTEYSDLDNLISICNQLDIKPYFILMPVNARFYDYLGINEKMRTSFYNNLDKTLTKKGFRVLNLQNKEYEPYYMFDSMHLGWKGWLDVDKKIDEYVNKY